MHIIVVDANVIAKIFIKETDSEMATAFLRTCVSENSKLIAPDLLKYEIAQIAIKKHCSLDKVIRLFDEQISVLVELQSPSHNSWLQAEKICQHGNEKSGFPSIYDSVYHAMAVIENGIFITQINDTIINPKVLGALLY